MKVVSGNVFRMARKKAVADSLNFLDEVLLHKSQYALLTLLISSFAEAEKFVDIERIFVTTANSMIDDPGEPAGGYPEWAAPFLCVRENRIP